MWRYTLTELAGDVRSLRGWNPDEVQIFAGAQKKPQAAAAAPLVQPSQVAVPVPAPPSARIEAPAPVQKPASASQPTKITSGVQATSASEDLYENVESIIIYRWRALQMFGGAPQMTQSLAKAINRYREELSPEINIFFMAAPIGSDFYLPRKVNNGVMREKLAIDHIQTLLDLGVKFVFAYDRLAEHKDEYIQFNTDHHWTGLGGYYAYTAFADAAGFKSLPLYADYARGGNAYGVFLSGDFPLMRVVSDLKNGKKIAVIKHSYGNAFVPYLAAHFEEVFILDYRYFVGNIKTLLEDNGIQNLLFAHNTFVVMGSYTA